MNGNQAQEGQRLIQQLDSVNNIQNYEQLIQEMDVWNYASTNFKNMHQTPIR